MQEPKQQQMEAERYAEAAELHKLPQGSPRLYPQPIGSPRPISVVLSSISVVFGCFLYLPGA